MREEAISEIRPHLWFDNRPSFPSSNFTRASQILSLVFSCRPVFANEKD
jgi:hypothetical protein